MHTYLARLQSERDSLTQTATALAERAATDDRDLTEAERSQLTTMQERCADIDGQLTTYSQQLDSQRAYAQLRQRLSTGDEADTETREQQQRGVQTRTLPDAFRWGEAFTASVQFRSYGGRGSSGEVELPLQLRAPIDTSSVFGSQTPPFYFQASRPVAVTPLIGAVTTVTTSQGTVSIFKMPAGYPVPALVPEGTAKPEADFVPTEMPLALGTYAHWKPITRQALEDIPQIQSIVEDELRGGISQRIDQLIADNIVASGGAGAPIGATVDLASIREAIGVVQAAGFPNANSVLLNPADWAALDIAVMQSTMLGPTSAGNFWGINPIASNRVPAGNAFVGDFRAGVTLFVRGTASVYLTDSHSDYFVKNILVVLAEARAACAVTQDAAIQQVGGGVVTQAAGSSGSGTSTPTKSAK